MWSDKAERRDDAAAEPDPVERCQMLLDLHVRLPGNVLQIGLQDARTRERHRHDHDAAGERPKAQDVERLVIGLAP